MKGLIVLIMAFCAISCNGQRKEVPKKEKAYEVIKTEEQWKRELTAEQYRILREKGTEAPFSGEYVNTFQKGKYVCAGCGNVLFESNAKYESDCGWPSFDKAIKGSVDYHDDKSFGMSRTEVTCAQCGGHLGHVFDDGPKETTGQRYCTNSVSVKFVPSPK